MSPNSPPHFRPPRRGGNRRPPNSIRRVGTGDINPLRYRGYVYDRETGLYYLQSRYYDPEIGRFINADAYAATGQGLTGNNTFAYCNNNPVNWIDRAGNVPVPVYDNPAGQVGAFLGGLFASLIMKKKYKVKEQSTKVLESGQVAATYNPALKTSTISNSSMIRSVEVMGEYIDENLRNGQVVGTTRGAVYEWVIHNATYDVGKCLENSSIPAFAAFGEHLVMKADPLDIGPTIYYDNHGIPSIIMWGTYHMLFPIDSYNDIYTTARERGLLG